MILQALKEYYDRKAADPDSGISFAYLTNLRAADPWHSERLDRVSNLVHSAIVSAPTA